MARWQDVVDAEPEFAERVRARFDAFTHKTLATLRRDGAPRISGIEATFHDGDLWLGMMPGSRKALDLQRDARLALHSGSADPPDEPSTWAGDAKVSGRGVEVVEATERRRLMQGMGAPEEQADSGHVFSIDLEEVVLTRVGEPADHLVIELWRPGEPLRRTTRT